ncbi:MAG TPA: type I phosphomannose isomerase catalytic subunit [Terriglobales bacterium]|nr:type I phosphomannose isomerase catalytic subunit [Terriglobales bacterium]
MTQLYPLLMSPAFDPRPWGTLDLSAIYPNAKFSERIGEAWLTGDNCVVTNGPLAKRTLADLSKTFGAEFVGTAAREPQRFPLLLKFLFPEEKLSVQVHPDDEAAQRFGEPWGKTECWYVAHAKPGSQIALGLKPGVTKAQFEQSIQENRAEELLNWINVYQGEMIYVAGGTVHTLGPGAVIVETQQQSDTTYRLYDYGRGRSLHLEHGLASVKERNASGKVIRPAPVAIHSGRSRHSSMIAAPYFAVDMFELKEPHVFSTAAGGANSTKKGAKTSVQILVAVEGCGVVEVQGRDPVTLTKGDAVVIPAVVQSFMVRPQWTVEFLKASVPGAESPEPAVRV